MGAVPDRGGRPSEIQAPPPEMPVWQKRTDGGGRGAAGRYGGGGYGRGGGAYDRWGGGSRGGWRQGNWRTGRWCHHCLFLFDITLLSWMFIWVLSVSAHKLRLLSLWHLADLRDIWCVSDLPVQLQEHRSFLMNKVCFKHMSSCQILFIASRIKHNKCKSLNDANSSLMKTSISVNVAHVFLWCIMGLNECTW